MARIPKRLFGPAGVLAATVNAYTVPAATKTIVRHIHVQNPGASNVALTVSIGLASNSELRIFDELPVEPDIPLDHFCYYIMEATEVIQCFAGSNNAITMAINGDELILG